MAFSPDLRARSALRLSSRCCPLSCFGTGERSCLSVERVLPVDPWPEALVAASTQRAEPSTTLRRIDMTMPPDLDRVNSRGGEQPACHGETTAVHASVPDRWKCGGRS